MRVGVFIAGSGKTGAPRRLLSLATQLRNNGLESSVITYKGHPIVILAEDDGVKVDFLWSPTILRKGVLSGGLVKKACVSAMLFLSWLAQIRFFATNNYDVVVVRSSLSGILYFPLYFFNKCKVVLDIDFELQGGGIVQTSRSLAARKSSVIIAQYGSVLDEVFSAPQKRWAISKFHSVIPGIDLEALDGNLKKTSETSQSHKFTLIQVGSVCERKNQKFSLEVVKNLAASFPAGTFLLQVVGGIDDEEYMAQLTEFVRVNALEAVVEFLGWRDDVSSLMSQADLLIMPSTNEGVPNTVQEAMYIGLPVIVSKAGGMPDIVAHGENGWVLGLDVAEDWTRQISELIHSPDSAREISISASAHARRYFGNSHWGSSYSDIIKSI